MVEHSLMNPVKIHAYDYFKLFSVGTGRFNRIKKIFPTFETRRLNQNGY